MDEKPPFEVGQRVRVKHVERSRYPAVKVFEGVVVSLQSRGFVTKEWSVSVRRDGYKTNRNFRASRLEPVPVNEMTLDDTCAALVREYHKGDRTAALLLAERIFEIMGGTPAPQQPSGAPGAV